MFRKINIFSNKFTLEIKKIIKKFKTIYENGSKNYKI